MPYPGALVISLDFELHWGVRDKFPPNGPYRANLLGERQAIPAILELFRSHGVHATWATVGMLFARSKSELLSLSPRLKPQYTIETLSPYSEHIGDNEQADPLHYAPTLIQLISDTPGQEIATHTFSHYYCLEEGQSAETFADDLACATKAMARLGIPAPESIVFPRNQRNPAYDHVLKKCGIKTYRGNQQVWIYRDGDSTSMSSVQRAFRLVDTYVGPNYLVDWNNVRQENELFDVAASFFLRPFSRYFQHLEGLRLARICQAIRQAARHGKIVHLWWHPHNFGVNLKENIATLKTVLTEFCAMRLRFNMESLTMREIAQHIISG